MISKVASLQELDTHWSVIDVLDCNEALDIQAEASEKAQKAATKR